MPCCPRQPRRVARDRGGVTGALFRGDALAETQADAHRLLPAAQCRGCLARDEAAVDDLVFVIERDADEIRGKAARVKGGVGLAAVGAIILSFLRVRNASSGKVSGLDEPARPLSEIVRQPLFAIGLLCAIGSYALMSLVMTGAPLAMVGCGFTADEATLGISWHVMAMFAPSFFTGRLIARFGAAAVVAAGLALLVACGLVALSGIALWQFWSALVLLGLGWNFGFIGATAMVADTYRASEQGKVLGFHDFILFGTVAAASFLSGVVYDAWGWEALNWVTFPVVALCVAALAALRLVSRREALSTPE